MIGFYVTDHSADEEETDSYCNLRELYHDIWRDGITSIRYDFRWSRIEPEMNEFDEEQLRRYAQVATLMLAEGLQAPTIILSSIPKWALNLYKKDKEGFFKGFGIYVQKVRMALNETDCKIAQVQVLNEWNNPIYTPITLNDLPRLCAIVRDAFKDYSEIKIMGTIVASNLNNFLAHFGFGVNLFEYLRELKKIRPSFDIIAVDYYPGLWHWPFKEAGWRFRNIFKQLGLLRIVCEELATWGKAYEIAEVGIPTNWPWSSEERQLRFYEEFFPELKLMFADFLQRGTQLPSRIGLYQAIDEPPKNLLGKISRVVTPNPEHDMGMRRSDGGRKLVLQSPSGVSSGTSRLSEIIRVMNK